jgi:hypothetical protein
MGITSVKEALGIISRIDPYANNVSDEDIALYYEAENFLNENRF